MAETPLVTFPTLPITPGHKLANELARDLDIKAAFWLWAEEAHEWRLVLATPRVDRDGPRSVYSRIRKVLDGRADLHQIQLANVSVLSPEDDNVRPIREALDGIDLGPGREVNGSVFNGQKSSVYLGMAYIYFAKL